jgi:predicted  nucleic acid-binding Zn-ribbon protein
VATVAADLKAGNFGQAKKDAAAVSDAFTNLQKSGQNLKAEQSQELSPQINDVKTTASNLQNSQSLTELGTNIDSLKSQIQTLSTQITNTLKCS